MGYISRFVYVSELPGVLDEFAAGILLARFIVSPTGERFLSWSRMRPWVVPGIAAVFVATGLQVYWHNSGYWRSGPMVVTFKSLQAVACALVVLSACSLQSVVVLLAAPLRYLGTISYGIYLWHLPVILAVKRVSWVDGPRALLPVIVLTLLFASLSWHFFEKPLMRRFRSRSLIQCDRSGMTGALGRPSIG